MTDRELLEAAAKAAGIGDLAVYGHFNRRDWNPLTDDGDALRLAVKLGLPPNRGIILLIEDGCAAFGIQGTDASREDRLAADPYAATRRAIVRAAAALGEP